MTGLLPTILRRTSSQHSTGCSLPAEEPEDPRAQAIRRNFEALSKIVAVKQQSLDRAHAELSAERQSTTALAEQLQAACTRAERAEAQLASLAALSAEMELLRQQLREGEGEVARARDDVTAAAARCATLQLQLKAKDATAAVLQREAQSCSARERELRDESERSQSALLASTAREALLASRMSQLEAAASRATSDAASLAADLHRATQHAAQSDSDLSQQREALTALTTALHERVRRSRAGNIAPARLCCLKRLVCRAGRRSAGSQRAARSCARQCVRA